MAHGPCRAGNGGVNGSAVLGKGGNIHIADAFAGQGQGLRIGVAHDGIFIQAGNEGHLYAAVHQLPVGLVGDDIDGVAVLDTLAL